MMLKLVGSVMRSPAIFFLFYDVLLPVWCLWIPLRPLMRCANSSKVLIPLKPLGLIQPTNAKNQSEQ